MMNWISMILSSAVIAAIISFSSVAKTNQLKYITSERTKWRKEIKKIASGLAECEWNNEKSKKLLTELKLQINSYGYKDTYPRDICLNCFTDEHIWKEIKAIEDGGKYKCHRDRLLRYLQLLLKFDWERSKREAKVEAKPIIMVMIYLALIIGNTIIGSTLSNIAGVIWTEKRSIIYQIIPLLVWMMPYFMEYVGVIRPEENYNNNILNLILFIAAEIIIVAFWMYCIWHDIWGSENVLFLFGEMFLIVLLFGQDIVRKQLYGKYSNAVKKCFGDSHLFVSYSCSIVEILIVMAYMETIFNYRDISYEEGFPIKLLSEEECQKAIRFRYQYFYKRKKRRGMTAKKFLKDNPKACKMFVKWNDKEIIPGFHPQKWKSLANEIERESWRRHRY